MRKNTITILTILAVLIALIFIFQYAPLKKINYSPQTTGTISISSNPSTATIYINNALKGKTPKMLYLPAGKYTITLVKPNYLNFTTNKTLAVGQMININPSLKAITNTFYITSTPSTANVYIDNTSQGITSLTLYNLKIGNHSVKVEKENYKAYNAIFSIKKGNNSLNVLFFQKGNYAKIGINENDITLNQILQNPYISGIYLTATWNQLEKTEGNYNWSAIDNILSKAINAKKAVTLNIIAGGQNTPDWILQNPTVQTITILDTNQYHEGTYCQIQTIPLFWDSTFLAKKKKFINALGNKYSNNPNIVGVMVSFANPYTNDWYAPKDVGTFCNQQINQPADWLAAGYTTDKMFQAGKETIDAWAAAFPRQILKLPISQTYKTLDANATKLTELITNYGYSNYSERFFIQINKLSVSTSYANDSTVILATPKTADKYILKLISQHSPQIGFQMLSAASFAESENCRMNNQLSPCPADEVLINSINAGISYSPSYIEYLTDDAENTELQSVLQYAENTI